MTSSPIKNVKARPYSISLIKLSSTRTIRRSIPPSITRRSTDAFPFFRPKLTIGPTNDVYEQEADAVADKVMRMEQDEEKLIQPRRSAGQSLMEAPSIVHDAINSGGKKLDPSTQSFMEDKFGYDFSTVKIHDDAVAARSAQSVNALAYTSGNDIVFNKGQYTPDTNSGKKLLAHELTHVVQQGGEGAGRTLSKKSGGVIQRSLQGYVDAMNAKPDADYGKAAKHLNGEPKKTIAYILENNLKGATVIKARLYAAGKIEPGVGPCSTICRMTERYYLELNPTEKPFDYSTCETKPPVPSTPSPDNKQPTPTLPESKTPEATPPEEEKPVDHENPSEMSECGFSQLYKECADAHASCEKVREYCNDSYPTADKKDTLYNEFMNKAKDNESDLPEASKNLKHFLGGSGTNKQIPKSLFESDSSFTDTLSKHRSKFIAGVEKRLKDGQTGTFKMHYLSSANGFGYNDLGLAVGGYTVCSVVEVELTETSPGTFKVKFKSWKVQIKDCYNWDPEKSVPFVGSDKDLCCIELFGRGKHFVTYTEVFDNTDPSSTADFTATKPKEWKWFDWGAPGKRAPDGTYYDKDGKMHMGPGPKY